MRRSTTYWLAATAALSISACATEPAAPPAAPIPQAAAEPPPVQNTPRDLCGAAEAQMYVGRSRTEIPVPVQPALQRVACTTCAITLDFNPRRLNFFVDAATGAVEEVKCG